MTLRTSLSVVVSLIFIGQVAAQNTLPLSLESAIKYGLANGTTVQKARLDIEQGAQVVTETRASALPQLNLVSSLTGNPIVQQFVLPAAAFGGAPGEFMAISAGQNWNAMTQLQLSQQLFNQQLFAGIKAAKGSAAYYEVLKDQAEQNVIQQIAVNYYMVMINREKLTVVAANLDRVRQLETIVSGQYSSGLAKKIDLDRIVVNIGNLEAQYEELNRALTQQENLLKHYMNMPMDQEIIFPEFAVEELEKMPDLVSLELPYDVNNLPDLLVLKKQEELLGYERKANLAAYYPTLSLDANYAYHTQNNKFNLYSSKSLNYDASAVSLTLRMPLFDGMARRSKVRQTDVSLKKIKEDISNTTNALVMAQKNANNQVKSSWKTIGNQKANMGLASEVFYSTRNNYQNGLATLTDLLTAETELVTAQNSYHEALLNFKIADIELLKSKGNIRSLLKL